MGAFDTRSFGDEINRKFINMEYLKQIFFHDNSNEMRMNILKWFFLLITFICIQFEPYVKTQMSYRFERPHKSNDSFMNVSMF